MFYKKSFQLFLLFNFLACPLYAGFPLNPDDQREMIKNARQFRAVGRIEYTSMCSERLVVLNHGTGTLVDAVELGLPSQFCNRVILTAAHVFRDLLSSFKKGMPKKCNTNQAHEHMRAYRFCVDREEDPNKPPREEFFELQSAFFCREYHPHNKNSDYTRDIAFAILKKPIPCGAPLKIMPIQSDEVVGLNVQRVGYGASGFLNSETFFLDSVKRAGGMTISSVCPFGRVFHYGFSPDPKIASKESGLRPGRPSITLFVENKKQVIEIEALNEAIENPELKFLLSFMSLVDLKSKLLELVESHCIKSPNRTLLIDQIGHIHLTHPIRVTGGAPCASFSDVGDSGGPALFYSDSEWKIMAVSTRSTFKIESYSFKDKLKNYVLNNSYVQKFLPRTWLEYLSRSKETVLKEPRASVKQMSYGPSLIQKLGVQGYSDWLDGKDGNFFQRLWSRFWFKRYLSNQSCFHYTIGNTLLPAQIFADAFVRKMMSPEKGFDPNALDAPIYSFPL